jgi:hypothetical protein
MTALEEAVATLRSTTGAQAARIAALERQLDAARQDVQAIQNSQAMKLNEYLEVESQSLVAGPRGQQFLVPVVRFTGVNVQIVNGDGAATSESELRQGGGNGLGNLIIGYNEQRGLLGEPAADRAGSHNLVVGPAHGYESRGGIVAGFRNTISGSYASSVGGEANIADGHYTTVTGGQSNRVTGLYGSISGGGSNRVMQDAHLASISGGGFNVVNNGYATISGGRGNYNEGGYSNISSGYGNTTKGTYSSVTGGSGNQAWGNYSSISGGSGHFIEYSGQYSSVSGGTGINVLVPNAWFAGGFVWP